MSKMIILDLDNTLLQSDKTISDYTISTLKVCQAKGMKVAFATARSTRGASRMMAQFAPDIFIGFGGALALSGNNIIYRSDMSAEISSPLIQECLQLPEVTHVYAINESEALTNDLEMLNTTNYSQYKYHNFSRDNRLSYLKISMKITDTDAVKHIISRYPMCRMVHFRGETLHQFTNKNAEKWNAV